MYDETSLIDQSSLFGETVWCVFQAVHLEENADRREDRQIGIHRYVFFSRDNRHYREIGRFRRKSDICDVSQCRGLPRADLT